MEETDRCWREFTEIRQKIALLPDAEPLIFVLFVETILPIMNFADAPVFVQEEDRLITKKRASERLSVSTRTIDRMAAEGTLEKLFVGASPRFRNSDIDAIVAGGL